VFELDEHVDVAVRAEIGTQYRAEPRQLLDVMAAAETPPDRRF
jgi:hypothetical protein